MNRNANRVRQASSEGGSAALSVADAQLAKAVEVWKAGNLREAVQICERLVGNYPGHIALLETLGRIQQSAGNHWDAHSLFSRAATLDPYDTKVLSGLADVYSALDAPELAIRALKAALAIRDDEADIHCALGRAYIEQRENERAVSSFESALDCDPGHQAAAYHLGRAYRYMGRMDEAAEALVRAHYLDRTQIAPVAALCQMPVDPVDVDLLAAIDVVDGGRSGYDEEWKARVNFSKAALFDKLKRHRDAWDHLVQANATTFARNRQTFERNAERRRQMVDSARHFARKSAGMPSTTPELPKSLLVLGPSRSGKTTLEMLLGTLAGVKRGYESPIVGRSVRRAAQQCGMAASTTLADLPEASNPVFLAFYQRDLVARAGGRSVFTNTHPGLIPGVGRLLELIPRSTVVFMKRDMTDLALRIFMKHYYAASNYYSYDINAIFEWLAWYYELADIWIDRFPERCVTVRYEDLVADANTTLKPLVERLGLTPPADGFPQPPDDRGCALPYAEFINSAGAIAKGPPS